MPTPFPDAFFARPSLEVARALVGARLVHEHPEGGRLVGRIVETEGYTQDDPAFHGWGLYDAEAGQLKKEGRGIELFGPPGEAYVYLIYGRYWLLNVVTEPEGVGGAVLIRAVEPLEGEAFMQKQRDGKTDVNLTNGPGKLTIAFGIDDRFHGEPLIAPPLFLVPAEDDAEHSIVTSSRIGISKGVDRQWRYFIEGHPYVSPGTPSDQR